MVKHWLLKQFAKLETFLNVGSENYVLNSRDRDDRVFQKNILL